MTANITRRTLIRGSIAGAAAAASGLAFAKAPESWDEEADVVVVGSGFAGLTAAYMAHKAGCRVIIIDKMPAPGGNSVINGGIMAVPGTELQKEKGITDTPEMMAEDMLVAGLHLNHPDKVKAMCEEALPAYNMLVNEFGVEFSKTILKHEGGHRVPRSAYTINGRGSEIISKELAALEKLGIKPRTRTILDDVVLEDGAVAGVKVREGYRFGKEESGTPKSIRAKKGVVLAYGGFGADPAYRVMFDPQLGPDFQSTNQVGATGEAWRMAARLGAQMIQQDWIQCLPYTTPDEPGFGIGWAWAGNTQAYGLWVDAATGERFVNELADRKVRCDAIFGRNKLGHECLSIGDRKCAETFEKIRPGWLKRQLEIKVVFEYPTLEALAKAYGIPMDRLQATIAAVNESITTKQDPMGRRVNEDLKPQTEGPWYVSRLSPKIHHCMGGILTTPKAEVINVDGKVIPGLFAAGECTGGVHGAVRLGSCATTDCVVNGRIAGMEVAKR